MVLQDLVNELGRRLDYQVTNGRYQGVTNAIGFDGLWKSPEDHALIIEVKTTDTYRLSLDTLAEYRRKLRASEQIGTSSSILIVVGRQDTGELEAQIRGSRHAWDVRLISAEALIKLVLLRENAEGLETGLKIRSVFMPVEYTRLDHMVDVMFTTVRDAEEDEIEIGPALAEEDEIEFGPAPAQEYHTRRTSDAASLEGKGIWQFTDAKLLQAKREVAIAALVRREGVPLVRKGRALYWGAGHHVRAALAISKHYTGRSQAPYWYGYHQQYSEFLAEAERAYFVLGCMDLDVAFAIPYSELNALLPLLNTTTRDNGTYWHINLVGNGSELSLSLPRRDQNFDLQPFRFSLAETSPGK